MGKKQPKSIVADISQVPPESNATLAELALASFTGKFQCVQVGIDKVTVSLKPETATALDGSGNGNESWSDGTPEGFITLIVNNPDMQDFFASGRHYNVVITAVEVTETPLDLQ